MPTSPRCSQAYDFSRHRRIADVAGGNGHLIEAVLDAHPGVTGVLFELPHVAAAVAPTPKLEVRAGDFFTDALPRCDAYLLMNIVHDWDDADSVAILTAVAEAGRHRGDASCSWRRSCPTARSGTGRRRSTSSCWP